MHEVQILVHVRDFLIFLRNPYQRPQTVRNSNFIAFANQFFQFQIIFLNFLLIALF